jgi:hypothetical protein
MARNPILDVPLHEVMRSEIALQLQQVFRLYTVGSFLDAWSNPKNHKNLSRVFDSPQQARHAAWVCAAWLGTEKSFGMVPMPMTGWWRHDDMVSAQAH